MIKIAICDDDKCDREALNTLLQKYKMKYDKEYDIKLFESGEAYLKSGFISDILFLDIIMDDKDGIQIGQEIKKKRKDATHIVYMLAYSTCEAIGGVIVDAGVRFFHVKQSDSIVTFVYTMGSSVSAMLLYYLILKRLFINKETQRISARQYTIYAIITAYVLVNIGEILFLINHELSGKDYLFLMVDAAFIIFINLYLFHLLDAFAENKDLKYKIALYERQAKSNYEYYAKQIENHKKALAVIHDVRKHMRIVDDYERIGANSEKEAYVDSFEEMVAPLLVKRYLILGHIWRNTRNWVLERQYLRLKVWG